MVHDGFLALRAHPVDESLPPPASLAALFARTKQRKEALFAYRESCRLQPAAPTFWMGAATIHPEP